MSAPDCYFALLTPPGRSAVATMGLAGHDAARRLQVFFSPATPQNLADSPIARTLFGRWQESDDETGEELVVCRVAEDRWEIHSHGGSAATDVIKASLQSLGCQELEAGAWLQSAGCDSFATEALLKLAACRTERAAAMMLDQYRGATRRACDEVRALAAAGRWEELERRLQRLLEVSAYVAHIDKPYRILIVGAPNVGKSSLINALLGYERAIVFDQPGTTRDVVSTVTALAGWLFELSDTAGIRSTDDALEAAGIERMLSELEHVDLVIHVRDATRPVDPLPLLPSAVGHYQTLQVWNKCDVAPRPANESELAISAATGLGIEELQAAILAALCPRPPLPGEAVPVGKALLGWCEEIYQRLRSGNFAGAQARAAEFHT